MKRTYYIVQVHGGADGYYAAGDADGTIPPGIAMGEANATHYSLGAARRVRRYLRGFGRCGGSRFPRIIRVAVETKTIKE